MIGCDCEVCRSTDPRDRRYRSSAVIQLPHKSPYDGRVILIDAAPEFRLAAIEVALPRVDAVLFTHAHADHIMGLDDIRRYNNITQQTIPCFTDRPTMETLQSCFAYALGNHINVGRPSLSLELIDAPREICGVTVTPIPLMHGEDVILGFRIGRFAYCTDCSGIPDSSVPLLEDLDLLVLDALRYTPHPTHFNLSQALEVIEQLAPRRALLIHIAHEIKHETTSAELPPNIEIAYDTLRVKAPLA